MGILINDEITMPFGLKLTGCYAGFSSNQITVTPVSDPTSPTGKRYVVRAAYNIWVNDTTRKAGAEPLAVRLLVFTMGPESLNAGVYQVMYEQLCSQFDDVVNTDAPPKESPPPTAPADQPADPAA